MGDFILGDPSLAAPAPLRVSDPLDQSVDELFRDLVVHFSEQLISNDPMSMLEHRYQQEGGASAIPLTSLRESPLPSGQDRPSPFPFPEGPSFKGAPQVATSGGGNPQPAIGTGGQTPTNQELPPDGPKIPEQRIIDEQPQLSLRMRPQANQAEGTFGTTFAEAGSCSCGTYYSFPTQTFAKQVPSGFMMRVEGISFEVEDIALWEGVMVEILVNGETRAVFRDLCVVPSATIPGGKFAFSSHSQPMPVTVFADHDTTIAVFITPLGLYPYTATGTANKDAKIVLHGFLTPLADDRDGNLRPVALAAVEGESPSKDAVKNLTKFWLKQGA